MEPKCISYRCAQKPELRRTGRGGDDPVWYCNICKEEYYRSKEKEPTKERPFKWPSKKKSTPGNVLGKAI